MLLEVQDLTVHYNSSLPAVDRVSFQIQVGESLGLVGESGCGKSTLGRSLIQLLPHHAHAEGSILIQGESLYRSTETFGERSVEPRSRRSPTPHNPHPNNWRGEKVALIFQDPMTRLNPLMTIAAHGLEMLRSHLPQISTKQAKQRFYNALQSVRIDPARANQYPHEFSGGMRQRVMIALSLLLDPALLIADEPTTSLDVTVAAEILQELNTLRRDRHMALLLITHDLGLVAQYCDRIAVMYDGAIVETGLSEQVFRNPQHPYTQNLLQSVIHFRVEEQVSPSVSQTLSPSAPLLLKVRNLTKHYNTGTNLLAQWLDRSAGVVKAIDGIDLDVYTGETLGIIGESGSGKSTTGRAILQLIRPDQGTVEFDGKELTRLQGEELRRLRSQMQMIFQDPRACLNPRMTVFRSIADPLLIHKIVPNLEAAKAKVVEMLDRVGLAGNFADRLPQDLSGGQLQRVAIARALITHPRFLICDEPVSMLDATIQSQILQLMLDLKQEFQLTYIFITHDLAVAQFFCDRIAVMRRGKIVEQGTTAAVLSNPQHEYTQKLLQAIPKLKV